MPIELKVPEVGESITEVQIGKWHKGLGQQVEKDESVVEIESDKATVDLPAPVAGTISKMLKQAGQTALVGEVIGYLLAPNEAAAAPDAPAGAAPQPPAAATPAAHETTVAVEKKRGQTAIGSVQPSAAAQAAATEKPQPPRAPFVMPAAERVLAEHGLTADAVRATGPGGRLLKEDVERHLETKPSPPAPPRQDPHQSPSKPKRPTTVSPRRPPSAARARKSSS